MKKIQTIVCIALCLLCLSSCEKKENVSSANSNAQGNANTVTNTTGGQDKNGVSSKPATGKSYHQKIDELYGSFIRGDAAGMISCWPDKIYSLAAEDGYKEYSKNVYAASCQEDMDRMIFLLEEKTEVEQENWKVTYCIESVERIDPEDVLDTIEDEWGNYYEFFWRDVTNAVEIEVLTNCWIPGIEEYENSLYYYAIEWNSSWYILNWSEIFWIYEDML